MYIFLIWVSSQKLQKENRILLFRSHFCMCQKKNKWQRKMFVILSFLFKLFSQHKIHWWQAIFCLPASFYVYQYHYFNSYRIFYIKYIFVFLYLYAHTYIYIYINFFSFLSSFCAFHSFFLKKTKKKLTNTTSFCLY